MLPGGQAAGFFPVDAESMSFLMGGFCGHRACGLRFSVWIVGCGQGVGQLAMPP